MPRPAILIAGVPGTGKSSYARWLAKTHGFEHIDVENQWQSLQSFAKSPAAFIAELLAHGSPVCFDWGFPPQCLTVVRQFAEAGLMTAAEPTHGETP